MALGARCATEFATPGLHVSIDEFEDPFRGAAKDRSAVEQCDRAGHQCRMLDQQADHVLARGAGAVALCVEIEGLELRVLANELFGIEIEPLGERSRVFVFFASFSSFLPNDSLMLSK